MLDTHALAFVHALYGVRASRPDDRALRQGMFHPPEYKPEVKSAVTVLRLDPACGSLDASAHGVGLESIQAGSDGPVL